MNINSLIRYAKNLKKYLKSGGVVYLNVSFTNPNERLKSKTVLITGGTSGIGLGIAKLFLQEGANVIITGRDADKLLATQKQLNNNKLQTMVWDIANPDTVNDKLFELERLSSRIDIFINNAGIYDYAPFGEVSIDIYDKVINTNQRGLYFMCQAEGMFFIKNNLAGKIINIGSVAGIIAGMDPYSLSKWGTTCITKGLAKELIKKKIIVNGIAPGNVITNIHNGVRGKQIEDNAYMPLHLTERYIYNGRRNSKSCFIPFKWSC